MFITQRPRKLSPNIVWFIYIVTFLGLLTSIIFIFTRPDNSKKNGLKDENDTIKSLSSLISSIENPEVRLEILIFYESLLHEKLRNISWIDGSNEEISYKNPRDDVVVVNARTVLQKSSRLLDAQSNIRNTTYMALHFYHTRQFGTEYFKVSSDKSYVAILWDEHKIYRTNPEYRVSIREFNSGIEKKIVKNGNFVSYFAFCAHNNNSYSYTYKEKHYECFLDEHPNFTKTRENCQIGMRTGYNFLWNWWGSERKKDYSVSAMCPSYEAYWNDDGNFLNDTKIDEILYQERGTILLYPRVKNFIYNRAAPEIPPELSQHSRKKSKPTFYFSVDGKRNWIPKEEEFLGFNTVSNDSEQEIERKKRETEDNYIEARKTEEETDFGMNRQHVEHLSRSYCREEPFNLVSVDYTVDYPNENAVFYSLQGKNNSYYFPSKEKAFFMEPAYGTIQLDEKPWVLHPIVYRNETTGLSTFNMAISTSNGFNPESQDTTYGYGAFFSFWNTIPKNRYTPLLNSEYYLTRLLKVRRDKKTNDLFAYFIAAPTRNVSRRHLYKIKIVCPPKETAIMESAACLTCPIENNNGGLEMSKIEPQCLWADVEMSYFADYYLLHCKGPDVPWTVLVRTETNAVLLNLRENEELRAWDALIKKPRVHEFEIELDDGFTGRVRMYFPPEWYPDIKKCPRQYRLLLHVDGTPEGQLITAKYKISWLWNLILEKNFVVLEADVRGSGYQSIDMSSVIWRKIGTLEIKDQISVLEYVLKKIECIDKNQVAVYGEAYGGYTALNVMAMDDKKLFKCCAAVSPITTWQHYSYVFGVKVFGGEYNNLYRTRYEKANLASRVRGLKDKDFIIYSGTKDREILRYHVNNLLIAFADNGIFFKHQQYIDQGHGIPDYRVHLYEHMYQYFNHCFAKNKS